MKLKRTKIYYISIVQNYLQVFTLLINFDNSVRYLIQNINFDRIIQFNQAKKVKS